MTVRRGAWSAVFITVCSLVWTLTTPATAGALDADTWITKADKTCRVADRQLFDRLERYQNIDVTLPVQDLTRLERRDVGATLEVAGELATSTRRKLARLRAPSSSQVDVDALLAALRHSAATQRSSARIVRKSAPNDPDLLVIDTAPPDETIALGIDAAGALGAHECGAFLGDLLWSRDPSLLDPTPPEVLASLIAPDPLPGFVSATCDTCSGAITISDLAQGYAGPHESVGEATIALEDLGFDAGYRSGFELPDSFEYASIELLQFADPAGAAVYLDSVRWGIEDDFGGDVYAVADIDRAWGYFEEFPNGEMATWVAFRTGTQVFWVGMSGVPGYSPDEVTALAFTQLAYLESPVVVDTDLTSTPEDAIAASLDAAGLPYVGDCSVADGTLDIGSYCSLLLEDFGDSRVYGIGLVASELSDELNLVLEGDTWVVVE
jgi:hypothetical protein